MKAALKTDDGRFKVTEVETPKIPAPDWVRARVRVAGICGTDLRHWKVPDERLAGKITGHELAGEIVEAGAEVEALRPGDRVLIETVLGDDDCPWCRVQHTGGTTGIGRAIALLLASAGARVLTFGRHGQEPDDAMADLREVSEDAHGLTADVTSREDIGRVFAEADRTLGRLDVLINNAALAAESIVDESYDDWEYVVRTNLLGYEEHAKKAVEETMLKAEDIAACVYFCLTRPPRCDIVSMSVRPHLQEI